MARESYTMCYRQSKQPILCVLAILVFDECCDHTLSPDRSSVCEFGVNNGSSNGHIGIRNATVAYVPKALDIAMLAQGLGRYVRQCLENGFGAGPGVLQGPQKTN